MYFFHLALFGNILHYCCLLLNVFCLFIFRPSIDFVFHCTSHPRKLMLTQHDIILGCRRNTSHSWPFLFKLIIVAFVFSYHVFKEQCACFTCRLNLKSSVRMAFPNKNQLHFLSWLFLNIKPLFSLVLCLCKWCFFISFCVLSWNCCACLADFTKDIWGNVCKIMTTAERSADLYFSTLYSNTNWFAVLRGQNWLWNMCWVHFFVNLTLCCK